MKTKNSTLGSACLFSLFCEDLLAKHKISVIDKETFIKSVTIAFEVFERDRGRPNVNAHFDQISNLYKAAASYDLNEVLNLLGNIRPEVLKCLEERAVRIGVVLPNLKLRPDEESCRLFCEAVVQLCCMGGQEQEGRLRPMGQRSKKWVPLLYASPKQRHTPKREVEREFLINLQLVWLEGTNVIPAITANHIAKGPFVRFAEDCMKAANIPEFDVVEGINTLHKAARQRTHISVPWN